MDISRHKDIYQQGRDFSYTVYESARVRRNWAYLVAMVFAVLGLSSAFALFMVLPLQKTVYQPVYYERDAITGKINMQVALTGAISAQTADIKSYLYYYIYNRETQSEWDMHVRYAYLEAHTEISEFSSYAKAVNIDNPQSELNTHGTVFIRKVEHVKSIQLIDHNTAQVRFVTHDTRARGDKQRHWTAVVGFTFVHRKREQRMYWINPKGFMVLSYRVDEEYEVANQ